MGLEVSDVPHNHNLNHMKKILILLLFALTVSSYINAQDKAQEDSLRKIVSMIRIPDDVSDSQKSSMGFIVLTVTPNPEDSKIAVSGTFPKSLVKVFQELKPQLLTIKWSKIFPKMDSGITNQILVPIYLGSDPQSREKIPTQHMADMYREAFEMKGLHQSPFWINPHAVLYTAGKRVF